jgi:hypothetical protein
MALRCARLLQNEETIFLILGGMYRDGTLLDRKDFYLLGRLALFRQEYLWAEEIFQTFLDDAAAAKPRFTSLLWNTLSRPLKSTASPMRSTGGSLTSAQKLAALGAFRDGCPVLTQRAASLRTGY